MRERPSRRSTGGYMGMGRAETPVVKRTLSSWVFSGNTKLQITLLLVIVITVFARVLPLEMQKRVVNEAIKLRNIDLLMLYCGIYLVAVISASGLKYLINVLQTLIGQRTTASIRKALYDHILSLPLSFFRNTSPGSVVSSLVNETTLPGNFVGMAIAVPVTNLLTLLAFAAYLLWLNPLLAAVSLSIYPIVLFLVPMLQKGANRANKKRVDTTRELSGRIAESISGIHEIHGNGAFGIENRKFVRIIDKLLEIRISWSLYREGMKTTNNFFVSLGPFLVFILGGYLTINGRLELGALVAFLSAQEKLYDPWKELIEFYQVYQEATITYNRTMAHFDQEPEHALEPVGRKPYALEARLEIKDLSFETDSGIRLLDNINLSMEPGEHLALVGFSGSGKSTLVQCVGQLHKYTGGHILLGDKEVSDLTKRDIVENVGIVAQSPFIFDGTIEENLLYAYQAKISGKDEDRAEILPNIDDKIEILQQTGIFVDVLRFGLNTILTEDQHPGLIAKIIRVRNHFLHNFSEALSDYVEFFEEDRYLDFSSILENLAFGTPLKDAFSDANLPKNDFFLRFLDEADLNRPLLSLGAELSKQTIDIIGNLPPDKLFFEQSSITPDELGDYKIIVQRLKKTKLHQLSGDEREKLLRQGLRFTPGIHKMVGMSHLLENLILEGRALFREKIQTEDPGAFSFYRMSDYIYSETILNNILLGKMKTSSPQAQEKINRSIMQLIIEEDLLETIIEMGMQFQVGSKGDRLSGGQRQKLAIARSFLKAPRLLLMDEATSALDNASQARIQNLLETHWKGKSSLIAVVHRLDTIQNYDKVAVMKAGKIVEMGTYDELMSKEGILYELTTRRK